MSVKMANAPVFLTICQVQHNPLLNLSSYLPVIQERMRKAGFPDFKRAVHRHFNISIVAADGSVPSAPVVAEESEQLSFSNASSTAGFMLLPTGISFLTTEYDTFQPFLSHLTVGLSILSEVVGGIDFVERLGLRYVDAVLPRSGELLSMYVAQELLGLPSRLPKLDFLYAFSEATLTASEAVKVVSRTVIQNGSVTSPADIQHNLKLGERFQVFSGEHAIIDTDGSFSERQPYDPAAIARRFVELHNLIDKAFHGSVTDAAREIWGQKEH